MSRGEPASGSSAAACGPWTFESKLENLDIRAVLTDLGRGLLALFDFPNNQRYALMSCNIARSCATTVSVRCRALVSRRSTSIAGHRMRWVVWFTARLPGRCRGLDSNEVQNGVSSACGVPCFRMVIWSTEYRSTADCFQKGSKRVFSRSNPLRLHS